MWNESGQFLFSATDLVNDFACTHLTELERKVADGALKREYRHDPMLELLSQLGQAHEQAYLGSLRAEGKSVVEIEEFGGQTSVEQAIAAMHRGVDVISQATLVSAPWRGRADFLTKVNLPSKLGTWSYEAVDTKLSQTTRAAAVLQLCLYTEIVAGIQETVPPNMHVVKPGNPFEVDTLRVNDFMAYYRMAKERFTLSFANGPHEASYPYTITGCFRRYGRGDIQRRSPIMAVVTC